MFAHNRASLALFAAGAVAVGASSGAQQARDADVSLRATRLHQEAIVLDTHIDVTQWMMIKGWDFFARHNTPQAGARRQASGPDTPSHVDYPRMKEGGLDGLFFSIYMLGTITGPTAVKRAELEKQYPGEENAGKRFQELRAYTQTLGPLPRASWEKIVEHIDHAAKLAGADHVGLGSDFDGASMPDGMEDLTRLPKITEALIKKGYTDDQIKGILGENLLKLMEKVEKVASGS